jgi:Necrosis inducing protein (NPP1)
LGSKVSQLKSKNAEFVFRDYRISFSAKLARRYKPIVYSGKCESGPPKAAYYRIVTNNETKDLCIQYYYYWEHQTCLDFMASHRYDYEPIFIYIRNKESFPSQIVNGGKGPQVHCSFHKNEIRPRTGVRQMIASYFDVTLSPQDYYPWGKDGTVRYRGCSQTYPLAGNKDLKFEDMHPRFGINACSNVFSGAEQHLVGDIFDPPLEELTDTILEEWYFKHYNDENDMPFGHDIADPFSYPYIKYRRPSKAELLRHKKERRRKYIDNSKK